MKQKPASKNWGWNFRKAFATRWPGIECVMHFHDSAPPTVTVTARRDEFRALERFIENYWSEQ